VKICAGFKSKDGALSLLRNLVRPPVLCCSFPWTNHTFAAVIQASVLTKHGERPGSRQDGTPQCRTVHATPQTCQAVAVTGAPQKGDLFVCYMQIRQPFG
jgi:hypothetical protein